MLAVPMALSAGNYWKKQWVIPPFLDRGRLDVLPAKMCHLAKVLGRELPPDLGL